MDNQGQDLQAYYNAMNAEIERLTSRPHTAEDVDNFINNWIYIGDEDPGKAILDALGVE